MKETICEKTGTRHCVNLGDVYFGSKNMTLGCVYMASTVCTTCGKKVQFNFNLKEGSLEVDSVMSSNPVLGKRLEDERKHVESKLEEIRQSFEVLLASYLRLYRHKYEVDVNLSRVLEGVE